MFNKLKCFFGFHTWKGWAPTFSKNVPDYMLLEFFQINDCKYCRASKSRPAKRKK